jgi:hypothetical protein
VAAATDKRRESDKFARINTVVTREAKQRIQYARVLKQQSTVSRISEGQIIVDLALKHLEAVPEGALNGAKAKAEKPRKTRGKSR